MSRVGNPSHPLAPQTKLSSAVVGVWILGNHEGVAGTCGIARRKAHSRTAKKWGDPKTWKCK